MTLLSIWGAGLWLIPVLLFGAAAYSGYKGYKSWTSGSYTTDRSGKRTYSDTRVPFYRVTGFVYGAVFLLAAIVVLIWVSSEA